jgi:outer membrane protein TolC
VTTRIVQVRQASAQIAAARSALEAASESYRLASARYKVGVGSSIELADAELTLSQAQTDLAGAANTLRTSRAELTRAVGVEDLARMPDLDQLIELDPIPGVDPERSAP